LAYSLRLSVGIVTSVPADQVGVAAAIFSAAQQVGGAINVAIINTISVQVQNRHPYPSYKGPSSALWFLVALGVFLAGMVLIFFKPKKREQSIDIVGHDLEKS